METNLQENIKYIVYLTINLVNNKIYIGVHRTLNPDIFDGYIGCGVYITNSGTYNNPTTAFLFAVKKYGTKNFKRTIIKICDTKELAYSLEKEIVDKDFINRKDVYNMIEGGINSPTNSIPINQFSLDGILLKTWDSVQLASEFLGVSHSAILNAIKFKGSCKKFYWSRETSIDINDFVLNTETFCYRYNKEGKLVNTYNSIPEAAKDLNESPLSIQRAIKGGFEVKSHYFSDKLYEEFIPPIKTNLKENPLYVYDLDGNFLIKLLGIKEICNYFNIKSNCVIYNAIRCNRPYKQYLLSFEYKDKLPKMKSKRNISKLVVLYSLTGEQIEVFDSITKAVEKYGTGVQKVLRGQQQLCKGFIFRYKSL